MLCRNTLRSIFRFIIYLIFTLLLFTTLNILHNPDASIEITKSFVTTSKSQFWVFWKKGYKYPSEETRKNLFLDTQQCLNAFPDFDKEVRDAVARGPFTLKRVKDNSLGPAIQGRIIDEKLHIISSERDLSQAAQQYRDAALHQIYRAIITRPSHEPIPDTHFSLSVNDNPLSDTWSFSRSNDFVTYPNQWIMPHFSYWSWPYAFIESQDNTLSKIDTLESKYSSNYTPSSFIQEPNPWLSKIDKLVWRGTAWFNPISNTELRKSLLRVTKDKQWADVKPLKWTGKKADKESDDSLEMEDFCKYRYIAYTEGITYSGRLPIHQACASVILTPPIGYLQHTSFLIKPIWGEDLSQNNNKNPNPNSGRDKTGLWPISYPISEANMIFVKPDWSDLQDVISFLQQNPVVAEGIARNQRELMVGGGYLSEAAEVCYWRALVRGWSGVVRLDEESWGGEGEREVGIRWEGFGLLGKVAW